MVEPGRNAIVQAFGSPRFSWALTITSIGTAVFSWVIRALFGDAGFIGIVATLCLFSAATLIARRDELEWQGLLPLSLLAFLGWSAVSIFWSQYQWATLGALTYQWSFALLAITVALTRDSIQIVRAFGDVFRVAIAASLALEIFSGLLIDAPIPFLGIEGLLAEGGPIQGLFGSRNQLGIVALLALITFAVELRTKSIVKTIGVSSVVAASLTVLLTRSPVILVVAAIVALATGAIAILRRSTPERRNILQWSLAGGTVLTIIVVYFTRSTLVNWLNAASESEYRIDLWRRLWSLIDLHALEGWGWIGPWNIDLPPFVILRAVGGTPYRSALNGFLDAWLQLGAVGATLIILLMGLTFVRTWLLASRKATSTIVWGALIMVALVCVSLAESDVISGMGWFVLVVCSVRAAQQLSWRGKFAERA